MRTMITWLGFRHVKYGVRPHHIPIMGQVRGTASHWMRLGTLGDLPNREAPHAHIAFYDANTNIGDVTDCDVIHDFFKCMFMDPFCGVEFCSGILHKVLTGCWPL
jgi:hypothetical protein